MNDQTSVDKQPLLAILNRRPHPAVVGLAAVALLLLITWWASVNGLLFGLDKWKNEQDRHRMYDLATRVDGDYSRLSEEERAWVEQTAHGHGRMAMGMYNRTPHQGRRQPRMPSGNPGSRRMPGMDPGAGAPGAPEAP